MMIRNTIYLFLIICFICIHLAQSDRDEEGEFQHPTFRNSQGRSSSNARVNQAELESIFWNENAQQRLREKLNQKQNMNKAKNLIIFLGDGLSIPTIAATRMYMGGEEKQLYFEKFPHTGLSKTYCVDKQVADSACTATAYLSGVKGNYGTIGVNAKVPRYQCEVDPANHVDSIAKWAQDAGKATGIVTTTRVTHASPAGNYASISERGWEHDRYIVSDGCDKSKVQDVAVQLVHGEVGKKFKVILGGGRYSFLNDTVRDEEGYLGNRLDGRNLIDEWKTERSKEGKAEYVWNTVGLKNLDVHDTDYLLGLFENTHCNYNLDIKNRKTKNDDPSLSEMVEVAIKMLRKEEKGYYLFVEGGKIDLAHHDNLIRKSLDETEEFSFAIELARRMTSEDDTLIVVTADHAHTLTYNGYGPRGNDIMGIAAISESDSLPYTTMSYANGRGYSKTYSEDGKIRVDITGYDFSNPEYDYPATVPLDSETHGGDDVAVYASGPKSHLFIGTYEQTNIPILMSYAAEIGMFADDENGGKVGEDDDGAGAIISASTYLLLLTSLSIIIRFF